MVVPPDLDRLREARAQVGEPAGKSWGGDHFLVRQEMVEAIDFLLSVAKSGGRLVVETPCEHGFVGSHWQDDPKPDDPKNQFHCPGGSRTVVWPIDKEESA